MKCPTCSSSAAKRGFYQRPSDQKKVQRYLCRHCSKSFSSQTFQIDYRLRLRAKNQFVFGILCSGVSQRRCARLLHMNPVAIARRVRRFGAVCERNLTIYRETREAANTVLFDELETFEHSKCKPLTVPIAVEDKTRKIIALDVGQIAAKGHLAKISVKKYGRRRCERNEVLTSLMRELKVCCAEDATFKTDKSNFYPSLLKKYFPLSTHTTTKGRRGCVVGQGELKRGGFDPLFTLNHSYAMFRDNLKTLSRRTWCTAKKAKCLKSLLFLYAWFHNIYVENPKYIVLRALASSN